MKKILPVVVAIFALSLIPTFTMAQAKDMKMNQSIEKDGTG